ncbi:MAG: uroporphyrinogen-III decarboxylase-like protein [Candidatus Aminicenantes bacterium]|nr:MAG: uroporphyrinogen-III decarboxylase-like protein [Candidatus Aminicenantes bacterium]
MRKETMSPRERWLSVINRQKPDRVPMDYWGTDEVTMNLMKHLGCQTKRETLERLHIDFVVRIDPLYYLGPSLPASFDDARIVIDYIGPPLSPGFDVFGRRYEKIAFHTGVYEECVNNPLANFNSIEEIERNYTWPSPDWWDFKSLPEQIKNFKLYPIQGGGSEPFLIYKDLRGQEQAFVDLIENPEMVHYCLDKLFDLAYEITRRILEAIPEDIMLTYVAEDMGAQNDLMFSPAQIREFLIPGMKRIIDLSHQAGAFVFHHNDGSIRKIIPDMIEAGIDILNPIQWRCAGMDREELKRDFGEKIIFHGGVDNQYTLPFGTIKEVQKEVEDNLRILGEGGGYILSPCHNIQPITPVENIIALYETGYNLGWQ